MTKFKLQYFFIIFVLLVSGVKVNGFPDQGKWDFQMNKERHTVSLPKSLFTGSKIYVQITCESLDPTRLVNITWILTKSQCWTDYTDVYFNQIPTVVNKSLQLEPPTQVYQCSQGGHIQLPEFKLPTKPPVQEPQVLPHEDDKSDKSVGKIDDNKNDGGVGGDINVNKQIAINDPVYTITKDGLYLFTLQIISTKPDGDFNATVHIEMKSFNGFLSAVDYPLLPFYEAMCVVYFLFGTIWLLVSFLQWRDLLRIQFWIGGVILLGMLEKAMFYAEYHNIYMNGNSVRGAVLAAEWVSCAKRTLARMLVVIVSLGFGIVKPRLGPMLHRVVGTGALYFVLACVESYLRVMHTKNDPSNQLLVASIPLAVLDSAICWWIFTSLVQTTRTLRLRRNMVKLTLYRHFTNTLIFAVIASVIFMLFSIKMHRLAECLTDWKDLWQDEAFWHVLFSSLLLVIMILWRPTNNNQRYAFTPLLDNPEDEDDEEEEDLYVSDAYGIKQRGGMQMNNSNRSTSPKPNSRTTTTNEEDDLRWVEENIPQAIADAALPVLDSDEEIINTKFEVSKMQ